MAWFEYFWLDGPRGNIQHIAEHDLTPDDVEFAFDHCVTERKSNSSGRPVRFGYTRDGRYIAVIFEWLDIATVYPVTAYEVEE